MLERNRQMDWDNRKVIDYERNMYAREIKETIHSIRDTKHINNISYNLPEMIPNVNQRNYKILILLLGRRKIQIVSMIVRIKFTPQ